MEGMGAGAILQVIPVVFVGVVLMVAFIRHQAARQQQTQGVLWLQAMRMLITHIQRHRGISAGVLSGDLSLKPRLEEVQIQVSRDFEQIGGVGDWIKSHHGWQSITQHWARLAGNVHRLQVERNIDQHNRLIKNILVLVDEIAVKHYLGSHSGLRSGIWRDLLTLAEYLGQIRAVGTVITAYGDQVNSSSASARKELQKLVQDVLATLESPQCRGGLDAELLQEVIDLLSYVDTRILGEGPMAGPSDYYAIVTRVIDMLYEQFDHELSNVNQRLTRA